MINSKISKWLPDMDLAFNLYDEPRVAVPFQDIERDRKHGQQTQAQNKHSSSTSFSAPDPSLWDSDWMNMASKPAILGSYGTPFQLGSLNQSFHTHGTIGCPPKSPALNRQWDPSEHCTRCAAPQSIGQFISNWTLAGDMCHQPDMANLHSFYLTPVTSKVSDRLIPVFSRSKVHGYNDILYPSAWDYLEKARYEEDQDVEFNKKTEVLFYSDSASQDFASNMELRGMERQRLAHVANNITNSTLIPLLINDNKLNYENIPFRHLHGLFHFNISLTDHEIESGKSVNLSEHWNYKYLMDMDVSKTFIPHLFSKSVPFRASIFRTYPFLPCPFPPPNMTHDTHNLTSPRRMV